MFDSNFKKFPRAKLAKVAKKIPLSSPWGCEKIMSLFA
jgi:hypothetical protein